MTNFYEITEGMTAEELDYVQQSLWTFNVQSAPPTNDLKKNVHLVIKREDQQIIAGLIGKIYRGCLFVDTLWVHEHHRKEGFGQRLLSHAENLAIRSGCWFIHLDTFSFQAPEFYKKNGFVVFGTLDGYPDGIMRYYLKKDLPR
jgi:GNAT superfamily N-acetyltransferase